MFKDKGSQCRTQRAERECDDYEVRWQSAQPTARRFEHPLQRSGLICRYSGLSLNCSRRPCYQPTRVDRFQHLLEEKLGVISMLSPACVDSRDRSLGALR